MLLSTFILLDTCVCMVCVCGGGGTIYGSSTPQQLMMRVKDRRMQVYVRMHKLCAYIMPINEANSMSQIFSEHTRAESTHIMSHTKLLVCWEHSARYRGRSHTGWEPVESFHQHFMNWSIRFSSANNHLALCPGMYDRRLSTAVQPCSQCRAEGAWLTMGYRAEHGLGYWAAATELCNCVYGHRRRITYIRMSTSLDT